ncbi:GNAT family N-acetyltransferase [Rossellomorea arthrocnemi]|jgi:streptothricin acetyltransferase|uniref:GNAT family N-acetyltransferase n=1 Tax=Rossellomorea arthrocnemi TaxID=2769542 RepID=UPI00191B274A|nr:GNAT family N-acetyltransferase [Rossellomorea arthrocnemi]
MKENIQLVPLTKELIKDVNAANDPFTIFGRIEPSLDSGTWSYKEVLYPDAKEIQFPDDQLNWNDYIHNQNKALFLAYLKEECIGQVRITKELNRFGYIENIAVKKEFRKHGIGWLLLDKAEEWAKENFLIGLSLEMQDDNVGACRFYIRYGFKLGGVDNYRYYTNPNMDKALFWYKVFS